MSTHYKYIVRANEKICYSKQGLESLSRGSGLLSIGVYSQESPTWIKDSQVKKKLEVRISNIGNFRNETNRIADIWQFQSDDIYSIRASQNFQNQKVEIHEETFRVKLGFGAGS